ncbi:MAG: hypothetical protein HZB81_08140 [Deltaproteobacteria bacterium]|nr:hypothetical protein [Deltaproteobacteria bacterium]
MIRQKLILFITACFVFILTSNSFAGILEYKTEGKQSIDVKIEGFYLRFNSSDLIKINGHMEGIGLSYTSRLPKNLIIKPEFWFAEGYTEYNGPLEHSNNSSPGTLDDVKSYLFELRTLLGYDYKISEAFSPIPYTGVGFRLLYLDVDGRITYTTSRSTVKLGSIDYTNIYIPFGIKFSGNLYGEAPNQWIFTATAEDDISLWKLRGNGLRGSIEFQRRFKYVSIAVEPFIRYWRFKEDKAPVHDASGNEVGKATEPANRTTEIGIDWKIRF